MRATSVALLVAALAGCYNPGDLGDHPFKCVPNSANADCPDGYICNSMTSFCDRTGASSSLPAIGKQGPSLTCMPPGLSTCTETDSNSALSTAITISTGVLNKQICPAGDVDVYQGANANGKVVKVQLCYAACGEGDLDVEILDSGGNAIASDGTARNNACAVTTQPLSSDNFFIVVAGAGQNTANYKIKVSVCSQGAAGCSACPSNGITGTCPQ